MLTVVIARLRFIKEIRPGTGKSFGATSFFRQVGLRRMCYDYRVVPVV